jgi:hypothetical protein
MSEGSLWGDLSTLRSIRTPKTILVEQADILNTTTEGVIRAQVTANQNHGNLTYTLSLVAPVLNNYAYTVCVVTHDINVYPCKIFDSQANAWLACQDEGELKEKLGAILSSEKTRHVIEALLSQSQS